MSTFLSILAATSIKPGDLPMAHADKQAISTILSVAFAVIGGLALLMITISGLRYIVAAGDPQKISKAKNGIIYSLIGLMIAISAEAIVAFVVNRL